MVSVLIGVGPNDLEIPLLIFPDRQSGERYVTDALQLTLGEEIPEDRLENKEVGETGEYEATPLAALLFKDASYYSGCGGCYSLRLVDVLFATPFIAWDLD